MSGRYSNGETKTRPGIYFRQETDSVSALIGATNGVVAAAFRANWGPLGEVVTINTPAEISEIFGDDSGENSNVSILEKAFIGGASQIKAVRVGNGGTLASITLKDNAATAADVVTLTAKYAGTRALSVTIKDSLSVTTQRECIIYSGTKELSKVIFAKGTNEVDALVAAINKSKASVVTATRLAAGSGVLAAVTQTAFTTAGVSPATANADYDAAFALLEASVWNTLIVDTDDVAVHALVKAFIVRANDAGLMGIAVLGEPTSVTYDNRRTHAAAFNSENVVYVLNGFKIDDVAYEGWTAAAVAAGLIAYLPSNDSPTHKAIPGATEVVGALTNTQVVEALQSGALVFTMSASGNVWIEQGINTLVTLDANQDAGWKKIRRTKTRFELITRINQNSEGIVGSVNNDRNGRATFLAIANGVINEMIAEGKLSSGSAYEDPSNPAKGDSAWFIIDVRDLDSIEKVYLTYRFHFSDD
ncbi:MAG: phage tail sheath subtilisin-like domain-containing protein [Clostridia bacterium]|nr:phage tail sheath subtilisin-like domain-containing protein [Clostridia bacterium]